MKYRIVELLQSIPDGRPLRVTATEVRSVAIAEAPTEVKCSRYCAFKDRAIDAGVTRADCARCYGREVIEGELTSDTGKRYRISHGIPRLLSQSASEFVERNRKSFSLEWKYFRFGERNWGMDIESRKALFLRALGRSPSELRGCTIFDAGCGSGVLSMEMANSFGMEVIALDLADGIEKAYAENTNPSVHYIQGSILEPPLRNGTADFIYCAGVLIHLPSTRDGFECLPRCLRPGGQLFVWVYHDIEHHRKTGDYGRELFYDWLRRAITSKLPVSAQEALYGLLLIPYFIKRAILNTFKDVKEDRTYREKMQNFVDTLSPVYANRHSEGEVEQWFDDAGFRNVRVAYHDRYGFGVRGDMS